MIKMTKKRQDLIDRLCQLVGAEFQEFGERKCSGKYAGTSDYFVNFKDGRCMYISNGARNFDTQLSKLICECELFYQKRREILLTLNELQKKDAAIAKKKGLMTYTIENIFLTYDDISVRAVVMLRLKNGQYFAMKESTQSCYLLQFLGKDGLVRLRKRTEGMYHPAGGIKEDEVDFVYHNSGYSSMKDYYNIFKKIPVVLEGKVSGASHYEDKADTSSFYFEAGDDEEQFFIKDHVGCNNCGSYKMSRDVLADAISLGLISDRHCGIWESDLYEMYEGVNLL